MFEFLFYIITRLLNILIYAVGVYSNDDCTLYTIQCTLYGVNTATYISIYMYIHTRKPKHMDNITWRCVFGDTHIPIVSWNTIYRSVSGQWSAVSGQRSAEFLSLLPKRRHPLHYALGGMLSVRKTPAILTTFIPGSCRSKARL